MITFYVIVWCVYWLVTFFIGVCCVVYVGRKCEAYKSGTITFIPQTYPTNPVGRSRLRQILYDGVIKKYLDQICKSIGTALIILNVLLLWFILVYFFEPSTWPIWAQVLLGLVIVAIAILVLASKVRVISSKGKARQAAVAARDMNTVLLSCSLFFLILWGVFLFLNWIIPLEYLTSQIFKTSSNSISATLYNFEKHQYEVDGVPIKKGEREEREEREEESKTPEIPSQLYKSQKSKSKYSFYLSIKDGAFNFEAASGFSKNAYLKTYDPNTATGIIIDGDRSYTVIFSVGTGEFYFK